MFRQIPASSDKDVCPICNSTLQHEGELRRCVEHGLFFEYGPRLLVRKIERNDEPKTLMPWQTLPELVT